MTKRSRFVALSLLLAILLAASLTYYFASKPAGKQKCDCVFPNSQRYGVIINGTCVETDCDKEK
jgi:hypothetical protein